MVRAALCWWAVRCGEVKPLLMDILLVDIGVY
jgi:hypothetical protein